MDDPKILHSSCNCLSIEVTTHCLRQCPHCFVRARGTEKFSLSPDDVRQMIREAYEIGYRQFHVTGGEPLFWNGLLDILGDASDMGYQSIFLNTDGTLLTETTCRNLAKCRGLALSVTLQGPKRHHDAARGQGSYQQARQGVIHAVSAGIPVYVFTTVGRSILDDLPAFAEELFTTIPGIRQLTLIQLIRVPGDVFDLSQEVLRPEDFIRLVRMVSFLNLFGFETDLLNNPLAAVVCKIFGLPWVTRSPPLYRSGSIMITADKRITSAHSSTEDFGRYHHGIMTNIIHSDDYSAIALPDKVMCPDCVHLDNCRRVGMIRPSEWYRDMIPHVPYCMRVLQKASSYG